MASDRLHDQIRFILEIDRLKGVLRRSYLLDGSRRENSAEHSWHVAVMAMVLAEHANEPVDIGRVVRMLLAHDIVEVDAGDTFAYDDAGAESKAERERQRGGPHLRAPSPRTRATSCACCGRSSTRPTRLTPGSPRRSTG